jgi:hypothetical protein
MLLLSLLLLGQAAPRPATPAATPAASPAAEATVGRRGTPPGQCLAVDLRPVLADPSAPPRLPRSRYSAASTLDLRIRATLRPGVLPGARLEFHVFTPQGHLYQRLPAVAALGAGPARSARSDDSRASLLPPITASASLLVAGTAIVNHSLYGGWSVEPHLEGDPQPCAPASRFWLEP